MFWTDKNILKRIKLSRSAFNDIDENHSTNDDDNKSINEYKNIFCLWSVSHRIERILATLISWTKIIGCQINRKSITVHERT